MDSSAVLAVIGTLGGALVGACATVASAGLTTRAQTQEKVQIVREEASKALFGYYNAVDSLARDFKNRNSPKLLPTSSEQRMPPRDSWELAEKSRERAVEAVAAAFIGADPEVRESALETLAGLNDSHDIAKMALAKLEQAGPGVRDEARTEVASQIVAEMGESLTEALDSLGTYSEACNRPTAVISRPAFLKRRHRKRE